MFDWDDLRYFTAFAEQGSLAAAARHLAVEHATVARRIAALEAALNLALVDRRGRVHGLTAEGEQVAALARRMAAEAFGVERFASGGQAKVEGEVTVSAPPAFIATLIAPRVAPLIARHPGLRLHLVGAKDHASLARKETDIALRLTRPTQADVVTRRLGAMVFRFYAQPAYLARVPAAQFSFIRYDAAMARSPQEQWVQAHVGERRVVLRSNDLRIQAEAAAAGAGVVLLPGFLASQYALAEVPGLGEPLARDLWLAYHADLRRAPALQVAVEFLVQCVGAARAL